MKSKNGNWTKPLVKPEDFARYLADKVKPQLKELLTQYGPIGLIWFETPTAITREQSQDLRSFVHSLQPDCLVSGRVGHDAGDYSCMGDNQITYGSVTGDWETPATLNNTWGYKSNDHAWISVSTLLSLLAELAGNGVNYLLNVGPTGEGEIPAASIEHLAAIGHWMDVNAESVIGTSASPFSYDLPWGYITQKGNRLYLLIRQWHTDFAVHGIRNKVHRAWMLAEPRNHVTFTQQYEPLIEFHRLQLSLPLSSPDSDLSVVVLDLDGEPDVDRIAIQQPDERILLPVSMATFHDVHRERKPTLTKGGLLAEWESADQWLSWRMKIRTSGLFSVRVVLGSPAWETKASQGHRVRVYADAEMLDGTLISSEEIRSERTTRFYLSAATLGCLRLRKNGACGKNS